jgi:hypothetical protein
MVRIALGCFEEQLDGSWVCRKHTAIKASTGQNITVECYERFVPCTTFAGYDDFTAYLASVSEVSTVRSDTSY